MIACGAFFKNENSQKKHRVFNKKMRAILGGQPQIALIINVLLYHSESLSAKLSCNSRSQ